jgi:tetratricopeptide (TPR) repeat protein
MPYEIAGLPLLEVVRVICEQTPAPLRGAATGAEDVDEDLETVVRKALEKSPDDRYSSAAALADDIDRYLLLQPILARPPSTMYQLRKLVQRHRGTTILVSAMLFLLLGFGVTMSLLYGSQNTQRRRAEAERARSEQTAKFLQDLLTPEEQGPGGADVRIRDVLAMAGPRIQLGLADHPGLRAGILNIMGNLYEGLGLHDQAEEHLRAALSLHEELWGRVHPEVGRDLRDLGRFLRAKGDYEGAGRYLEESLAILRRVHGGNHPDVAWSMEELARVRELRGDFAGAVTLLRGSVAIRSRQLPEGHDLRIGPETQLGRCLLAIGKTTEAESILVRTWRAAERSSPSSPPKRRDLLVALVDLYEQTGRPEAASRYEAALGQIPIGPPPWMERPGPGPRPEPGQGPPGADRRPQTQGR